MHDKVFLRKKFFGDRRKYEAKMEEVEKKRFEHKVERRTEDDGLMDLLEDEEDYKDQYAFNEDLFKNISRDIERLYVSGSEKFIRKVVKNVEELGIPKRKLFLV